MRATMTYTIHPYLKRTGILQPLLSVSKKQKPSPSQGHDLPRFFDNPDRELPLVLQTGSITSLDRCVGSSSGRIELGSLSDLLFF